MSETNYLNPPSPTDEEVEALVASNGERLQRLQMHHIQLNIETLTLRHLIEVLFPNDEDRRALHISFQLKLAEVLTSAEEQVDALTLQRSAQEASALIVPGT